ncbi:uncharacterized protein LOC135849338 isoform X2 [Planococcus citri]|uniref:uncharacterized protein LOC135849338 isoform X2 n=1 Tax=Planococcus citri TaxID=170843 RepID=UPI0031F7761D
MICGGVRFEIYIVVYFAVYQHVTCVANAVSVLVNKGSKTPNAYQHDSSTKGYNEPQFPSAQFDHTDEEIVSRPGESISLPCSVKYLGDNVVSWIRRRDLKILTSGMVKFTGDKRFHIDHSQEEANNWTLILDDVQNSDSGFYECQINTEPNLKRAVLLLVFSGNGVSDYSDREENRDGLPFQIASILGPSERFVHYGSTVTLSCYIKINDSSRFPLEESYFSNYRRLVKWLHYSDLLTIESSRGGVGGGISIDTRVSSTSITSQLTIATVTPKEAGPYTCKPIKGSAHNVTLIIIQNEDIEAMKPENFSQSRAISENTIRTFMYLVSSILLSTGVFLFNLRRV